MNLNVDEWKEFRFGDLISRPYKAKAFNKDDLEVTEKNGIRYITRTGINNGCEMIVNATTIPQQYIEKGNAISIGDTTATCFYQDEDFITGDHMVVIRAEWLNKSNGLFIVSMLQNEQYKYSYGRAFLIDRIQETRIKLPIQHNPDRTPYINPDCTYSEEGYVPDWQFMEDYVKSLHHKPLTTQNTDNKVPKLNTQEWEEFKIGNLFDIHPTKTIPNVTASDCVGYGCPLVVNSAENNGIAGMCDLQPTEKGGIITFSDTTDGNTFFYQNDDFIGFSHVQGMYHLSDKWNKYSLLFFATIIMYDCNGKFNYGRKMRRDIISDTYVKLPIQHNSDGTPYIDPECKYSEEGYVPDWQFMEDYIRSLPYGDRL